MQTTDDLNLIERFKNGDASAFEEIVLKYQDKIYNLCRHMLGNAHDAEDAAQDVFLKAYQALPKILPEASLYTWLHRIATNNLIPFLSARQNVFFPLSQVDMKKECFTVSRGTIHAYCNHGFTN